MVKTRAGVTNMTIPAANCGQEENAGAEATAEHGPFTAVMGVSALVGLAGIGLAYLLHLKSRATSDKLASDLAPITRMLEEKYWVDEIYQDCIVDPLREMGKMFFAIDRYVVDGLVWLVSFIPQLSGFALK